MLVTCHLGMIFTSQQSHVIAAHENITLGYTFCNTACCCQCLDFLPMLGIKCKENKKTKSVKVAPYSFLESENTSLRFNKFA